MTDNREESQIITVELDSMFATGLAQECSEPLRWVETNASEPIFTAEIPLEPVTESAHEVTETGALHQPSLEFAVCRAVQIHGCSVDPYTRTTLTAGGKIGTSVDTLSRSVLFTDGVTAPVWSAAPDEMGSQVRELLTTNIERHEREHVRCLIDPETALWHEVELFWRSVLLGANSRTWHDEGFLSRFIMLFTTPSRFTVEALAMATEEYTMADSTVQQLLEAYVTANRGAEAELMQCFDRHGLGGERLNQLLRTPMGEVFCDLWLAYIVDALRSGISPEAIDPTDFRERVDGAALPEMMSRPGSSRREFLEFVYDRCFGPVFEVVRLQSSETDTVLERTWYSMNPTVSNDDSLLAVRRAIFRRQFLSRFSSSSGLTEQLATRTEAVERVIHGASLDDVALFEQPTLETTQLSGQLTDAKTAARQAILGSNATAEELAQWLNDPTYALDSSC